ncbi:MAG: sulfotransferase [Bacteroidota bacterium]
MKYTRWLKRPFAKAVAPQYVFVLCPPYCGSTLMHEMLCSSPAVSANNLFGTREGQSLPEYRRLIDYRRRWEEGYAYPWPIIKKIWQQYWDHSKPLLLDKSPPNLIRTAALSQHFSPFYFIIMVRNPYVHCEGLMRRDKMSPQAAAALSLLCLRHQRHNLQQHPQNSLLIRYEDLTEHPQKAQRQLLEFLPQLKTIKVDQTFKAHNQQGKPSKIKNMNAGKLERLQPGQLERINAILGREKNLLAYFNYDFYNS